MDVAGVDDGLVIKAQRTVGDGTDMSVPYDDCAIADTVVTVERKA